MLSDKHLAIFGRAVYRACGWGVRQSLRPFRFPLLQRIFLPDPPPATSRTPTRQAVLALICLCVTGALFGRMIHAGTARGMDAGIYEVVQDAAHAIAVAISDQRFHLNRGYVGYAAIFNELEKGGFTTSDYWVKKLGRTYPDNLRDRALLNETLQTVLNMPVPKDVGFGDRSLLSMGYAELGLVDYFKLAFRLFGYRVELAFYIYSLLLGISTVIFILAYWRSTATLAIPILFLAAGNLIFATTFFDTINSQTVANTRFLDPRHPARIAHPDAHARRAARNHLPGGACMPANADFHIRFNCSRITVLVRHTHRLRCGGPGRRGDFQHR